MQSAVRDGSGRLSEEFELVSEVMMLMRARATYRLRGRALRA
jgi:hypothetical protein